MKAGQRPRDCGMECVYLGPCSVVRRGGRSGVLEAASTLRRLRSGAGGGAVVLPRELDGEDGEDGERVGRLLESAVVCLTSVGDEETRLVVEELVSRMGGEVERDLTRTCTHLVVGMSGSAKQRASIALKNAGKLRWVTVEWVLQSFDAGERLSEEKFEVLPLTGCRISLSGMNAGEKVRLEQRIAENGGEYSPRLDQECTHLIADNTTGEKFKFAVRWGIPIFSRNWILDKVKMMGCVPENEERYQVRGISRPEENDSINRLNRIYFEMTEAVEKNQDRANMDTLLEGKLIQIVGFDEKFTDLQQIILKVVALAGGFALIKNVLGPMDILPETSIIIVPVDTAGNAILSSSLDTSTILHFKPLVSIDWLIQSILNREIADTEKFTVENLAPSQETAFNSSSNKNSLSPAAQNSLVFSDDTDRKMGGKRPFSSLETTQESLHSKKNSKGIFSGMKFQLELLALGPAERRKCQIVIIANGGSLVDSKPSARQKASKEGHEADVIVSDIGDPRFLKLFSELSLSGSSKKSKSPITVSSSWILDCDKSGSLLPQTSSIRYLSFPKRTKIDALSNCIISVSQIVGDDRKCIARVAKSFGFEFSENFQRQCQALLCFSIPNDLLDPAKKVRYAKLLKAQEWEIPIVHFSWLYDCVISRKLLKTRPYEEMLQDDRTASTPDKKTSSVSNEESEFLQRIEKALDESLETSTPCRNPLTSSILTIEDSLDGFLHSPSSSQ